MKLTRRKPLEREVQRTIVAWLRAQGALVVRVNSSLVIGQYKGKRRAIRSNDQPGCSDLLCVWKGRFLAVEVKRPGGKPTEEQKAFLQRVERAGGIGVWVSSVDELAEILEGLT